MLYREINHRAADLHRLVVPGQKRCPLFDEDKRAKLALIVFEQELSSFKLDLCMAA